MSNSKYSFDTSALIDGWERYYPPDIMPDLWNGLEELIENGIVFIHHEAYKELLYHENELSDWMKENNKAVVQMDETQIIAAKELLSKYPKLVNVKKKFSADVFVISLAKTRQCKVVTGEKSKSLMSGNIPPKAGNIKIPDVCYHESINCFDLVGFFRDMKWTFSRNS